MTLHQRIFNRVKKHLLQQNSKATCRFDGETICVYRAKNGNKCAAGALIQNKHYSPDLERNMVDAPIVREALCNSLKTPLEDMDIAFIKQLQYVHDENPPRKWPSKLKNMAEAHKLKY